MSIPKTAEREGSGRMRFGGAVLRAIELHPGAQVAGGAYEITGVLGRGGMATVYSAVRQADGREVAFKVLNPRSAARADVDHRLHNERMLAAEVGVHPSIVAAQDGGRLEEQDGAPFVVTERVYGPELSYVIATERRLDPMRACRLALDIADGLAALHGHGIAHRDVKPDNILVVSEPCSDGVSGTGPANERAKLIDFGLATRIVRAHDGQQRVTQAGERPGTLMYMCPEQSLGAGATAAFDVYGLGVTLYEMLAGVTPFAGVTDAELLEYKLHRHAAMDLAAARGDLPGALPSLVARCLAPLPSKRLELAALQLGLRAVLGLRRAHFEREVDVTELSPRAGAIEIEAAVLAADAASTPAVAGPSRADLLLRIHAPDPGTRADPLGAPAIEDGGSERPADGDARAGKRDVVVREPWGGRWIAAGLLIVAAGALGAWAWSWPRQKEVGASLVRDATVAGDAAEASDAVVAPPAPAPAPEVPFVAAPIFDPDETTTGDEVLAQVEFDLEPGFWIENPEGIELKLEPEDSGGPPMFVRVMPPLKEGDPPRVFRLPPQDEDPAPRVRPIRKPATPQAPELPLGTPTPTTPTKPAVDASATPECERARAAAEAARSAVDWSGVLVATRARECWRDAGARTALRVRAFANLDRWQECIDAAAKITDDSVRRQADGCRKQIQKQTEQP